MSKPARSKWWDDVVSVDLAPFYGTRADAETAEARAAAGKSSSKGQRGTLLWGDRVRVLERSNTGVARISARGMDAPDAEMWVLERDLGGEPLLELYVIDVGQGDGLLLVTPRGHHVMIDGGNLREQQNSGKNAADFVDWKFARDYLSFPDRKKDAKRRIQLDAMVASHCDQDHFGGLFDLLDRESEKNLAELDCTSVQVDTIYHAGLSWWYTTRMSEGRQRPDRTLGPTEGGLYTRLLGDRTSAVAATADLAHPTTSSLSGSWARFVAAATTTRRAADPTLPSDIVRLSSRTHDYLSGFAPDGPDSVSIRVLGPIEETVSDRPGLRKYPDGDSKNTNGHSIVLRVDYGDRRLLLTGDLNTHSQNAIMKSFGADFLAEFRCDVAKGCHHGSHDVSYRFLDGLRPVATVISSGDAESHDHPRPTIVAASALTGRRLVEGDALVCPLIYMTEIARSVSLAEVGSLAEYTTRQPPFPSTRPTGATKLHDTEDEMARFRLLLGSSQSSPLHWPRLDRAKVVSGLRYGLVNVRTDGKRLLFAQLEESGDGWAVARLEPTQIAAAR